MLNAEEVCACDVVTGIGKSAATTSHHLNLLRTAGPVTSDRRGTWIHYRVLPERIVQLRGHFSSQSRPEVIGVMSVTTEVGPYTYLRT